MKLVVYDKPIPYLLTNTTTNLFEGKEIGKGSAAEVESVEGVGQLTGRGGGLAVEIVNVAGVETERKIRGKKIRMANIKHRKKRKRQINLNEYLYPWRRYLPRKKLKKRPRAE